MKEEEEKRKSEEAKKETYKLKPKIKLTGKVTNKKDKAINGVNIYFSGSEKKITTTDINGNYSIEIPSDSKDYFLIQFIGGDGKVQCNKVLDISKDLKEGINEIDGNIECDK